MSVTETSVEEMTVAMSESLNILLDHLKVTKEKDIKKAREVFAMAMGEVMGKIAVAKVKKHLEE